MLFKLLTELFSSFSISIIQVLLTVYRRLKFTEGENNNESRSKKISKLACGANTQHSFIGKVFIFWIRKISQFFFSCCLVFRVKLFSHNLWRKFLQIIYMHIYFFFFIYNSRKDGLKELIFNDTLQALPRPWKWKSTKKVFSVCKEKEMATKKSELPPFF